MTPLGRSHPLSFFFALTAMLISLAAEPQGITSIALSPGGDGIAEVSLHCSQSVDPIRNSAIDSDGNVFVAGCSMAEILVMKFDSKGTVDWIRRVSHPGPQRVYALTLDDGSNSYIVTDLELIKINANGTLDWRITLPWAGRYVLARQAAGVVLLGTESNQSPLRLAKFNDLGEQLWISVLNELGSLQLGRAWPLPNDEIVFNGSSSSGLLTALVSGDGAIEWSHTTAASIPSGNLISPIAVAMDGSIYSTVKVSSGGPITTKYDAEGGVAWTVQSPQECRVVSSTATADGGFALVGTNGFNEFVTVKHDGNGIQQWLRRFGVDLPRGGQAGDISSDASGAIYSVGTALSGGRLRMAAVKYSSSGLQLWGTVVDSLEFEESEGLAAKFVPGQGLRVWGHQFIPYYRILVHAMDEESGVEQWSVTSPAETGVISEAVSVASRPMEITREGRAYLLGVTQGHVRRARLFAVDESGQADWSKSVVEESIDLVGSPSSVATDSIGNVYVAVDYTGRSTTERAVLKFDRFGEVIWRRSVAGEKARVVAADDFVYAVGDGWSPDLRSLAMIEKWDADGIFQWSATYERPLGEPGSVGNVAMTSDGGLLVVSQGRSSPPSGFMIAKYSSSGDMVWSTHSDDFSNDGELFVEVGAGEEIYVGTSGRVSGGNWGFVVHTYSSLGVLRWSERYFPEPAFSNWLRSMALHPNGGIVLAGSAGGRGAVMKIDDRGYLQWQKIYEAGANGPLAAVDDDGNTAVLVKLPSSTIRQLLVSELSANGREIWGTYLNDDSIGGHAVRAIRKLADGAIVIGETRRVPDAHRDSMAVVRMSGGALFISSFEQGDG